MKETLVVKINCNHIDEEALKKCAALLQEGGIVAFPTETVYGLGANALDPEAVKKIFVAKGRPSDNPLIVHVANPQDVKFLANKIPSKVAELMDRFWPGPLTLVFEKNDRVPYEITAGLSTVAIRIPDHPIAIKLIEMAKLPVAAPSANLSGRPSPTKAQHVIEDLMGKVDAIIVADDCKIGVESTVLDMTGRTPTILRPGGITREMLEEVLDVVELDPALTVGYSRELIPRSPGMKYTHYAPKAPVLIVQGEGQKVIDKIKQLQVEYADRGKQVGIICTDETYLQYDGDLVKSMGSRDDLKTIAANLFRVLREFDHTHVDMILAEAVEEVELGQAIMNRLLKAASYRIIKV